MNIKKKGKVHPSPSSSSYRDALSVLKLLPAAILALASALSVEDREVLAYMITRSITIANPPSNIDHKKKCRRPNLQKLPLFECGCFDCYTSYWFRWDSSPKRELIHQAIEAFEDHLSDGELVKKHARGRKRDKLLMGRRGSENPADISGITRASSPETLELYTPESEAVTEVGDEEAVDNVERYCEEEVAEVTGNLEVEVATVRVPVSNHKGLARKVLPDVVGLLNSRLWSLWGPNI